MARSTRASDEVVYQAAARWIDAALRSDDSLFTPGLGLWSARWLDELHERFVLALDESGDAFHVKLERQLDGASPEAIQLMAEVLYVHVLVASADSLRPETKRRLIRRVLDWLPTSVEIPGDLDQALESGLAAAGPAFNTYRPFQLHMIIEFVRAWKAEDAERRTLLLDDPWEFRAFLFSVTLPRGAHTQREALLHLVHPAAFEQIVSRDSKKRIAKAFTNLVSDPNENVDRRLLEIREKLADEHGVDFHFWDPEILRQWQPDTSQWGRFIHWASRLHTLPDFDHLERDYKLTIAERLTAAKGVVLAGEEWYDALKVAFTTEYNLTSWQADDRFLTWCREEPDHAQRALAAVWKSGESIEDRVRGFMDAVPTDVVSGRGTRVALASVLLMAIDPTEYPNYRPTVFEKGFELTGFGEPPRDADEAETYLHALAFLDKLSAEASSRGLELRDRLDAQSVLWAIVKWSTEDVDLPHDEKAAFLRYRGEQVLDVEADDTAALQATDVEQLARDLMVDADELRKIERLLGDKRQAIFYGPPGTGKTFVAQELARMLAADKGRVDLVQFHPSYAYEDFVEGYRPTELKGGTPGYELKPGPLKRIAKDAATTPEGTFVLVIDEINRGNVAKVFGELYFLLEYRDRDIALQYQTDEGRFSLPENLWIIGTMNTADRSIALLDAALRRRFHFIPFFPDSPLIDGLLRRWLAKHRPEMVWVADAVDRANIVLDDPNGAIGPSHFLRHDLDDEWVELIWEHSILPYVQEYFFGEPDRWREFTLERVRSGTAAAVTQDDARDATPFTD